MVNEAIDRTYSWLLPTLEVYRDGERLLLSDTEREATYTRHTGELLAALELFDGSRTLGELLERGPVVVSLIAELLHQRWLVQLSRPLSECTGDDDVKSRQLSYFAHVQRITPDVAFDELAGKRVLIVGTGGIGSHLAVVLAGSGVKRFVLNDPDTVSNSNLNRQVHFTRRDIGRFKVEVLAEALAARFDGLEVETCTINHDEREHAELPACDAVVVCGERESIWSRPELVRDRPLLMAGYFGPVAVVGPCVLPGVGPSWSELLCDRPARLGARTPSNRVARARSWNCSGAAINTAAAGLLGEATLRVLAPSLGGPILVGERLELDMRDLGVRRIDFSRGVAAARATPWPSDTSAATTTEP